MVNNQPTKKLFNQSEPKTRTFFCLCDLIYIFMPICNVNYTLHCIIYNM